MTFNTILFEIRDKLAYLTFNRPRVHNAINMRMMEEVEEALECLDRSEADILVITGAGQAFCAGADTMEFLNMTVEENQLFLSRFGEMVKCIQNLPIPVIGVINGFAFGGGAEIAAACDFRIASRQASFRFPGASYGLVVSTSNLPIIVGVSKAKEILFRSCVISAEEALQIQLIDHLLDENELVSFSEKITKEIQANSKVAVKKVKEVINTGIGASLEERMEIEKAANDYLVGHTNYRDTFSSFVEKRKQRKLGSK
ncbi:enoyl-CoA hydratase/isomerase family protein [Bacillus sp. FJAT-27251]|uniref:enoyl-CoA hydratase/isomerase family protein n=1 Tax=Bacillus sp. FJAT-27251 TaxID=1684142 RepID=UPI0006A7B00F|nr:enoyl-CoA hydratase/isomerase family protein [Bacillus sp. FJAT-27251]